MSNLHQINGESQQLVPPRNTYRQFLASACGLVNKVYDFITACTEGSSRRLEEPDGMTLPTIRISEQVIPNSSQIREELGNGGMTWDQPGTSHEPSRSERSEEQSISTPALQVPQGVTASSSLAGGEFGNHGVFCDRSEGPTVSRNLSHNGRSPTPVPSESAIPPVSTNVQGASSLSFSGNPNLTSIGVNRGVNVTTTTTTTTNVTNYGGSHGLEHLEKFVSFNAFYNSTVQDPDRKCHPGTRVVVLTQIRNWIDDPSSAENVFWLYGPAGAGKSAIAQTIARSYSQEQVAATFFFYRSDITRNDGNFLFTSIAWQLAFSIPGIKDHIVRSLNKRPDFPRMDVETQFQELILQPFLALKQVSTHLPSAVVIIDGVDECTDEKLQRRFLKVIGNAVKDNHIPLRFLISSRPEAHIQETIDSFPETDLRIDLASLDDANHDIEKYLRDEFSRIASEQGFDSTRWPGEERIRKFVYKSSGQFVYPSTVIRYVSDEYNSAATQLDIILGLKPQPSKSPFAELDALYLEILDRQPDRDFLITFLAILVARLSIGPVTGLVNDELQLDDAILMNVSEFELHRKLRGMRSLFKFDPHINLYHRSFLDFLQDSSRSSIYYMSQKKAQRRYLELITHSVVRFVSKIIDQPNSHENGHFQPQFGRISRHYPRRLDLPVAEWEQALQPLLNLQDSLLILPNYTSTWNLLPCDTCTAFQIMRDLLLHLVIIQGTSNRVTSSVQNIKPCLYYNVSRSTSEATRVDQLHEDNLVGCINSLIQLQKAKLEPLINSTAINLMCSLLHFDHVAIAKRVCSVAGAQFLIDVIDSLTTDENLLRQCGPDTVRKATCLALEIYARVPVLPRSIFSNSSTRSGHEWYCREMINFDVVCQTLLLGRVSDPSYFVPLLRFYEKDGGIYFVGSMVNGSKSLKEWRQTLNPSSVEIVRAMLEVAKSIQYLHSIGVVFTGEIEPDDVFLDTTLHAKIRYLYSAARYITETPSHYLIFLEEKHWMSYETNIFIFGCFFYEMYFNREIQRRYKCNSSEVSRRPSKPEIREEAWQLIQRCCAADSKARPTMDQVVHEMESWNLA